VTELKDVNELRRAVRNRNKAAVGQI